MHIRIDMIRDEHRSKINLGLTLNQHSLASLGPVLKGSGPVPSLEIPGTDIVCVGPKS